MKRIYIILLVIIASSLPAAAQQMLVDKGNDSNEIVNLENLKRITFNGTTVNIEQTDGTTSSADMGEISRIYFGDFSAIDDIKPQSKELISYLSSEAIAINCEAGTIVTIYDVIGSQVASMRLKSEGGMIGIAQLPKGIYIIKANDRTAKFIKR